MGNSFSVIPPPVEAAIRSLGLAVSRARRARGDTQAIAAERSGVHLKTIGRIERGDATVAIGTVFSLLAIYGMTDRLFDLAEDDDQTQMLAMKALPKRGRRRAPGT